jgi:hypothetical protein
MSDFEVWCRYHINDTNPESLLVAEQVWDILQAEIERLKARIKIVREADDAGYLVIHAETNKLEELIENAIWGGNSGCFTAKQ